MAGHLETLSLAAAADGIASGDFSAEELTRACLDRIAEREDVVKAWAFLEPDGALAAARDRDRQPGRGPLHGVPIGIKDIFDTKDFPTEYGSPIYAGHQPEVDAACVATLKSAGAVILGKTRTTELAALHPTVTANPHDPRRTPGGSSSGSAAAVADRMVPAALGTQTFGSVIRPAAYCGVVGFKPTFGAIARAGTKPEADGLDTIGTFTRSARDLPLLAGALMGHPTQAFKTDDPTRPTIGICRGPAWDQAEVETQDVIDAAATSFAAAGAAVREVEVPAVFEAALDAHFSIARYEMVRSFADEWQNHRDQISETLAPMLAFGETVSLDDYHAAQALAAEARRHLADLQSGMDVLLTASQPGEAPEGLGSTGNPVFNRFWTLMHVPCVTLPAGHGPNGLPVGVQLIGHHYGDVRLIAVAQWAEVVLG